MQGGEPGRATATDEGCQVHLEESLVKRAQQRDTAAFATIYEEYVDRVYRYILLRVGIHMDAEDLTEQVFLKALESIGSFKWRGAPFGAWHFRIAQNLVIDFQRRKARRPTAPLEDWEAVATGDPQGDVELKLSIEELVAAVARLTEAQRQVIALRFGAGLSIAETAGAMNKNEGAVKALQHSAVASLRRILNTRRGGV